VLIEMQDRQRLLVHRDVTSSVDAMLRGEPVAVELRYRDDDGNIRSEPQMLIVTSAAVTGRRNTRGTREGRGAREIRSGAPVPRPVEPAEPSNNRNGRAYTPREADPESQPATPNAAPGGSNGEGTKTIRVFPYGVARNRLYQAAKQLGIKVVIVENLPEADVLVTLKSYYRKRRRLINDAEHHNVSVYVLRANTVSQMERFLIEALGLEVSPSDPFEQAISETERAIALVQSGQASVDLNPVSSAVRRYQHQMVRQANLVSHSYGQEPYRHVRVFNTPRND
jgi:hypothetical protein